jgi:hypothetical protein
MVDQRKNLCYTWRRKVKNMSNLISHAEKELSLIGYDGDDEYNHLAKNAIMELITTFSKQGHSGFSASYVIEMFTQLANYETLSPLTGKDDEWIDVNDGLYQNIRNSAVFKQDNMAYYVDAYIWVESDGSCFTNRDSIGYIKSFPFTPKKFYIKIDKDGNVIDSEKINLAKKYYQQPLE